MKTIYMARHGSHAYGLNIETSDEDFKGVCIPPLDMELGFLHNFEQKEEMVSTGHAADTTVYSLRKFMKLASNCNPNIIEVLFCDDADVLEMDAVGRRLRESRDLFLSRRAFASFSGYALSQEKHVVARGLDDVRARKNAIHLVRLSRMCLEILRGDGVIVKRPDREELLEIRRGEWSMDKILREVSRMNQAAAFLRGSSALPEKPNLVALDALCVSLLREHYEL